MADPRDILNQGQKAYLADLLGVGLTERATEDSEILAEDEHLSAVDQTVASDHTVTVVVLLVHAELVASVGLQHVVLAEASLVEQQANALSSSELSTVVLSVNSLLSTTQQSALASLFQALSERILQRHNSRLRLHLLGEVSRKDYFRHSTAVVADQAPQHAAVGYRANDVAQSFATKSESSIL